jgi:hypothetical protein
MTAEQLQYQMQLIMQQQYAMKTGMPGKDQFNALRNRQLEQEYDDERSSSNDVYDDE